MRILFINVPSRAGPRGRFVPLGPLYAAGAVLRAGHDARICDPYVGDDPLEMVDALNPEVVGFGGIATSYGRMKKLSLALKNKYPDIIQIAGGPLASVLNGTLPVHGIYAVFNGEAETTLPAFLNYLENSDNDRPEIKNPPQVENLDTIPPPPYHLIDIPQYLDEDNPGFPVMTSRGCTNRCSFCYRHMTGYRQHSVPYVMRHLSLLEEEYGLRKFLMGDELFNHRKEWVMEFCHAMQEREYEYRVMGARVNPMDEEMLVALKASGCTEINYGHESGSDGILREYRKGTTAEMNRRVTMATRAAGIGCPVQLVIGGPAETSQTIKETILFLRNTHTRDPSVNYLIPLPEAPIWQYVKEHNLIPDVERFLDIVAAKDGGSPIINLTNEPWYKWRVWAWRIKRHARCMKWRE